VFFFTFAAFKTIVDMMGYLQKKGLAIVQAIRLWRETAGEDSCCCRGAGMFFDEKNNQQ
jgi:hypothetical protein